MGMGLGAGMQSAAAASADVTPASTDCMPSTTFAAAEEEQGYIVNFLSYVNLIVNFLFGFFGSLFGGIARVLAKPGPTKYFVILAIIGAISFLTWIVLAMTGNI